jgi:hypothetical protein
MVILVDTLELSCFRFGVPFVDFGLRRGGGGGGEGDDSGGGEGEERVDGGGESEEVSDNATGGDIYGGIGDGVVAFGWEVSRTDDEMRLVLLSWSSFFSLVVTLVSQ